MSKNFVPLLLLFAFLTAIVVVFKPFLESRGFDIKFLIIANSLLFALSLLGFFIQVRGLSSANTNAFMRGIYGALLMKLFIIAMAVLVYVFLTKGKVNKPSLFTCMGLYFLYAAIEVKQLIKILRKKPDA